MGWPLRSVGCGSAWFRWLAGFGSGCLAAFGGACPPFLLIVKYKISDRILASKYENNSYDRLRLRTSISALDHKLRACFSEIPLGSLARRAGGINEPTLTNNLYAYNFLRLT